MAQFAFHCCDKSLMKTNWGGKGCLAYSHSHGRSSGKPRQEPKQMPWRSTVLLFVSFLCQPGAPARGGTAHNELSPSILITN